MFLFSFFFIIFFMIQILFLILSTQQVTTISYIWSLADQTSKNCMAVFRFSAFLRLPMLFECVTTIWPPVTTY